MKKIFILITFLLASQTQAFSYTYLVDNDPAGYAIISRATSTDEFSDEYQGWYSSNYTGYYLGTIIYDPDTSVNGGSNDSDLDLWALIKAYLGIDNVDSYSYSKADFGEGDTSATSSDGLLTVTCDTDCYSGTWSTEDSDPPVEVSFYVVKAGVEYALYFVNPSDDYGTWSTEHLLNRGNQQPEISHLSAALVDPGTEVPEPATMLLFGTGLVGLAGIARRRRS